MTLGGAWQWLCSVSLQAAAMWATFPQPVFSYGPTRVLFK